MSGRSLDDYSSIAVFQILFSLTRFCPYSQEGNTSSIEGSWVFKSICHVCPSAMYQINHPLKRAMKEGNAETVLKNISWFNLIVELRKELCVPELGKGHLQLLNQSGNGHSGLSALKP